MAEEAAEVRLNALPADAGPERFRAQPAPPQAAPRRDVSRAAFGFLSGLAAAQFWVEGSTIFVPRLAQMFSGNFLSMSTLAVTAFVGLMAGNIVGGGPAVRRWGERAVFLSATLGRTLVGAAMAYLWLTNGLGWPR